MNAARRSIATIDHNAGRSIAVIGGGIGGLTAALAFARHGAQVTVFEQAPAITEVGAGLQITPNGARVLASLLPDRDFDTVGVRAQAVTPVDGLSGRQIARFDLTRQDPPYRFYHRADLIDMLATACGNAGVKIVLDARIEQLDEAGAFKTSAGRVTPDVTIGADGVRSVVRTQLNQEDAPFFTRQVAWRAVIDRPEAAPVARVWMLPGRHLVTYPLRNGRLNIVAVQERSQWADEGWHHEDAPGNLRAAFADACWEIKSILGEVSQVNLWGLFRHPVAAKWHNGTIAILGDAAHPTLPFLAQGANLAVEDAYVLARCCNENGAVPDALQTYQQARQNRVTRAIAAANANAVNYHLSGIRRRLAHTGLGMIGKVAPDAFLRRLRWLYDHDVTA